MKISDIIKKTLLLIFIGTIASLIIYGYIVNRDTKNNGKVTVGKYVFHEKNGKHETNYFMYYIDGEKFRTDGGRSPEGFEKNIGKFYEIRYSTNFANSVIADYSKEVTDRNRISKAGFRPKD